MAKPAVRAAAIGAALLASGRRLPARPRRYLVFWGGGLNGLLPVALQELGVPVEVSVYSTTVRGRRYRRYKIVVRDAVATRRLVAWDRAGVLGRMIRRYWQAVLPVVSSVRVRSVVPLLVMPRMAIRLLLYSDVWRRRLRRLGVTLELAPWRRRAFNYVRLLRVGAL